SADRLAACHLPADLAIHAPAVALGPPAAHLADFAPVERLDSASCGLIRHSAHWTVVATPRERDAAPPFHLRAPLPPPVRSLLAVFESLGRPAAPVAGHREPNHSATTVQPTQARVRRFDPGHCELRHIAARPTAARFLRLAQSFDASALEYP